MPGRISGNKLKIFNRSCYYRTGTHKSISPDFVITQNYGIRTYRGSSFDKSLLNSCFRLISERGIRILVKNTRRTQKTLSSISTPEKVKHCSEFLLHCQLLHLGPRRHFVLMNSSYQFLNLLIYDRNAK